MSFGEQVKHFREMRGLTQEQLAYEIGVAKTTITGYEKGNRQPDVEKIKRLASALHVSGDELLEIEIQGKISLYSEESLKLAKDFDALDAHGKQVLRLVSNEEMLRCRAQQAKQNAEEIDEEKTLYYIVPGYSVPMSAGTGQPGGDEFPENYKLLREPPRGTSFIAPVSGNSMEPSYYDGQLVFVHATENIPVGKVGAFWMDGKQWIKELGDGVLISHNPAYEPRPMTDDIRCQGLVLGTCDKNYFA